MPLNLRKRFRPAIAAALLLLLSLPTIVSGQDRPSWVCFNSVDVPGVPDCGYLYMRDAFFWEDLEPEFGQFRCDVIRSAFDLADSRDLLVGLRFPVDYIGDEWLPAKGLPSWIRSRSGATHTTGDGRLVANWDSPAVRSDYRRFLQGMADCVSNHPARWRLLWVDTGIPGDTSGEWFIELTANWPELLPTLENAIAHVEDTIEAFPDALPVIHMNAGFVEEYGSQSGYGCELLRHVIVDRNGGWREDGFGGYWEVIAGSNGAPRKFEDVYQRCPFVRTAWHRAPVIAEPWGNGISQWQAPDKEAAVDLHTGVDRAFNMWGSCPAGYTGLCDRLEERMGRVNLLVNNLEVTGREVRVEILNAGYPTYQSVLPGDQSFTAVVRMTSTGEECACPIEDVTPTERKIVFCEMGSDGDFVLEIRDPSGEVVSQTNGTIDPSEAGSDVTEQLWAAIRALEDRVSTLEACGSCENEEGGETSTGDIEIQVVDVRDGFVDARLGFPDLSASGSCNWDVDGNAFVAPCSLLRRGIRRGSVRIRVQDVGGSIPEADLIHEF